MSRLEDGQLIAAQVYGNDYGELRWAVIRLDYRFRTNLQKAAAAWRAAAAAYGSSIPSLSVYDPDTMWLSGLPKAFESGENIGWGTWSLIEPNVMLSLSTEPDELREQIELEFEQLSPSMSYSNLIVNGLESFQFEGGEKHSSDDCTLPGLPKEVLEWALGPTTER